MFDIDSIASQVKHNCNISDAEYWGLYSPCGLLLRLRDLYRTEKDLKPWEKAGPDDIGVWIGDREKLWEELDALDFQKITINGKKYRPFDVKGINDILLRKGFLYGAGFGNFLKPTFFLAELVKKSKKGRYSIYISGREISRDLSTAPAMLQGNTVIARQETVKFFLWDKFEEMKSRKYSGALFHAFSEYGISKNSMLARERLEGRLSEIAYEEISSCIYHELGEASQRKALGRWWKDMIIKLPYSRAELFIRGIKDILSDTCSAGMLAYIIRNKKAGSLAFYVAMLGGFRKIIFPDMAKAYDEFLITRRWPLIEKARIQGYKKAGGYIKILRGIADKGRISPAEIENELISKVV